MFFVLMWVVGYAVTVYAGEVFGPCEECEEFDWIAQHECSPVFYYRYGCENWTLIRAPDHKQAAIEWAKLFSGEKNPLIKKNETVKIANESKTIIKKYLNKTIGKVR